MTDRNLWNAIELPEDGVPRERWLVVGPAYVLALRGERDAAIERAEAAREEVFVERARAERAEADLAAVRDAVGAAQAGAEFWRERALEAERVFEAVDAERDEWRSRAERAEAERDVAVARARDAEEMLRVEERMHTEMQIEAENLYQERLRLFVLLEQFAADLVPIGHGLLAAELRNRLAIFTDKEGSEGER